MHVRILAELFAYVVVPIALAWWPAWRFCHHRRFGLWEPRLIALSIIFVEVGLVWGIFDMLEITLPAYLLLLFFGIAVATSFSVMATGVVKVSLTPELKREDVLNRARMQQRNICDLVLLDDEDMGDNFQENRDDLAYIVNVTLPELFDEHKRLDAACARMWIVVNNRSQTTEFAKLEYKATRKRLDTVETNIWATDEWLQSLFDELLTAIENGWEVNVRKSYRIAMQSPDDYDRGGWRAMEAMGDPIDKTAQTP